MLHEKTLLLTNKGYISISAIVECKETKFQVLNENNKFVDVTITEEKEKVNKNNIYSAIRINYHPFPIICTNDQLFLVRKRTEKFNNSNKKYEFTYNQPSVVNALDLTKINFDDRHADRFYCSMVTGSKTHKIIPKFNFINYKKVSAHITIEHEYQWWMMGYFVGDGWINHKKRNNSNSYNYCIYFVICHNQIEEVVPILQKTFPKLKKRAKHKSDERKHDKCDIFTCSKPIWWDILRHFGHLAHNKKIPHWVFDAPHNLIKSFISGYCRADGNKTFRKNKSGIKEHFKSQFSSVSPNLAFGIQNLYIKLGWCATVKHSLRKSSKLRGKIVQRRPIFGTDINWFQHKQKKEKLFHFHNDNIFYKIKKETCEINMKKMLGYIIHKHPEVLISAIINNKKFLSNLKIKDEEHKMYLDLLNDKPHTLCPFIKSNPELFEQLFNDVAGQKFYNVKTVDNTAFVAENVLVL